MGTHTPVLLHKVVEWLKPAPGTRFIDATAGLLGHSIALAQKGADVLALDRDPTTVALALAKAKELKQDRKDGMGMIHVVCGNFADIASIAQAHNFTEVDGILFDLGLSSWQLDASGRGFSFQKDEPLDMRFNPNSGGTKASDIINSLPFGELDGLIAQYAEEELSKPVALAICRSRPLITTAQLSATLDTVYARLMGANNPEITGRKARVYQAIRIVVNDELTAIKKGLQSSTTLLKTGGRLAVISFHSLEDRIAKQLMKNSLHELTKTPVVADENEVHANPRSRSAKLRIGEKL